MDEVGATDYVFVLDHVARHTVVRCVKENIRCLVHEPPEAMFPWFHEGFRHFGRVFSTDPDLTGRKYIKTQSYMPASWYWRNIGCFHSSPRISRPTKPAMYRARGAGYSRRG